MTKYLDTQTYDYKEVKTAAKAKTIYMFSVPLC